MEHTSAFGELITTTMSVLDWNLWWRFGPWEARQPAIDATLVALNADVICIQETWPDQVSRLADLLGMQHIYGSRQAFDGVQFGNAILSKWPIARTETLPLPVDEAGKFEEGRTILFAEIEGPRGTFQVFNTHLNWRLDQSAIRQIQVKAIFDAVDQRRPRTFPAIVTGDFNAGPDTDEIRMMTGKTEVPIEGMIFHDAWESTDGSSASGKTVNGNTWANENAYALLDLEPSRRIDYVFVGWPKGGGAGHAVTCRRVCTELVDGVVPSDHYGVLAELRY